VRIWYGSGIIGSVLLNGIVDCFYAYVGRETEEYLRDLPDFNTLNTVAKLIEKVKARYTKTPNKLCERFNFRRIKIMPNETITNFNARLNSHSKYCGFNNYSRDLAHLDLIILNAPQKLREKLLLEKDLTLKKAIDIASIAAEGSSWASQFCDVTNVTKLDILLNIVNAKM